MFWVYILQCQKNKWYVGSTTNPNHRLDDHMNGGASAWTKKYPPIQLYELIPECDEFDEDKHTKRYIKKYGIDNVRGGSYCQITLPDDQINILTKELHTGANQCFNCGQTGHYTQSCPKKLAKLAKMAAGKLCTRCGRTSHNVEDCKCKTHKDGGVINDGGNNKIHKNDDDNSKINDKNNLCQRCGRDTHTTEDCKCKTHKDGGTIIGKYKEDDETDNLCQRCGRTNHNIEDCKYKTHKDGNTITDGEVCERCGRDTHKTEDCKCKTHIDGHYFEQFLCTRCGRDTHKTENCTCKTHKDGHRLDICNRCGRDTHKTEECKCKTHKDGRKL